MTPAGFEPATFRFVAQHLNHCATADQSIMDIEFTLYNTMSSPALSYDQVWARTENSRRVKLPNRLSWDQK